MLPGGVASSGGVISGTPTAPANYPFTVKATDSTFPTAQTATQPLAITISAGLTITTSSFINALAGSPYSTWRDIVLTNRDFLAAALDLFARHLDDLRERLASRELEADFDSANELYKLLRDL